MDHLVWTQEMATLITAADARVTRMTRPANKQLWITGTMSARAKKEIEARGWRVQENSEARLFSWSEAYPDYQKAEERIPSGLISYQFEVRQYRRRRQLGRGNSFLPGERIFARDFRREFCRPRRVAVSRRGQSL